MEEGRRGILITRIPTILRGSRFIAPVLYDESLRPHVCMRGGQDGRPVTYPALIQIVTRLLPYSTGQDDESASKLLRYMTSLALSTFTANGVDTLAALFASPL